MKNHFMICLIFFGSIHIGYSEEKPYLEEIIPLTILFTGDIHSHLLPEPDGTGGAARIAGYYERAKKQEKNLIILDAGDMVTGTPVSMLFEGEPGFEVLNHFGLDAMVLGNHEFDHTWKKIERYGEIADFPILCSNVRQGSSFESGTPITDAEYTILETGGLRILIIGVVTETTPGITKKVDTVGVVFEPAIDAIQRIINSQKTQVDIIISLNHTGFRHDLQIAKEVPELNLIVGGHTNTVNDAYLTETDTYIIHAGYHGKFIGRADLTVDPIHNKIQTFQYTVLDVNDKLGKESTAAKQTIEKWESKVSEQVDKPLGTASQYLNEDEMTLIAKAAFLKATGADFAHQNRGGTRGPIRQGEFTYRDVWNVFPFINTVVTAQVKGKDIPEEFFGYNPIDPEKTYRIVTNSYVRDQAYRLFPTLQHVEWEDSGVILLDTVIEYIKQQEELKPVQLTR